VSANLFFRKMLFEIRDSRNSGLVTGTRTSERCLNNGALPCNLLNRLAWSVHIFTGIDPAWWVSQVGEITNAYGTIQKEKRSCRKFKETFLIKKCSMVQWQQDTQIKYPTLQCYDSCKFYEIWQIQGYFKRILLVFKSRTFMPKNVLIERNMYHLWIQLNFVFEGR
jgi:hypothetical protein